MELSVNGHPISSPIAIVEFGKEAEITMSHDDGVTGWQFRIIADELTTIRRMNVIPISVDLFELANGQRVLRASPHFNVAPGQRADLETIFADEDGRKAHIVLVANLRSQADVDAMPAYTDGEQR